MAATWKVKAYIEYEVEADSQEEAMSRLTDCVITDLQECDDLREIAEVAAEKIRDTGIEC